MRPSKNKMLIEEAVKEYTGLGGALLCTAASVRGWYEAADLTRYKSIEERQAVRFMFAYLLLLVEGEEE